MPPSAGPQPQVFTLWPCTCCNGSMPDPIRIAKHVTDVARCSRAEAEQYIEGGWVRVDSDMVEDPQW